MKKSNRDKHGTPPVRKLHGDGEKKRSISGRHTKITSAGDVLQSRGSVQTVEDTYLEPVKRVMKPTTQLHLSKDELREEITRVLTTNDPNGECARCDRFPRTINRHLTMGALIKIPSLQIKFMTRLAQKLIML